MSRLRTALTGVAAIIGLALIIGGVPFLLLSVAGSPLPSQLPTLESVQNSLARLTGDATVLLGLLKYAAWLAWAWFTVSALTQIVVQLAAAVAERGQLTSNTAHGLERPITGPARHVRVPRAVDAGWIAKMVAAAIALFAVAAGPVMSAPSAAAAGVRPGTPDEPRAAIAATAAIAAHPATAQPTSTDSEAPRAASKVAETTTVTVPRTVIVDRGDTLSEISLEQYGTAAQWPKIFRANHGAPQGHGQQLNDPDLIYPGAKLTIPGKSDTVTRAVTRAPQPAPSTDTSSPSTSGTSSSGGVTKSVQAPNSDAAASKEQFAPPTSSAPSSSSGSVPGRAPAPTSSMNPSAGSGAANVSRGAYVDQGADSVRDFESVGVVRTVTGLGAIAAAGALGLLTLRRRRQSRTRRPGQRINLPSGPAAVTEAQLRAAADPLTVRHVDLALRTMSHNAIATGMAIPSLRAARITPAEIELYLTDPAATLPEPFTAAEQDPGVWVLDRSAVERGALLDETTAALSPAPYPTLVTIGQDEDEAHLLVNVEELRTLAITGPDELAEPVLAAIALELIASQWADAATITLVGVLPELADSLGAGNVSYVENLDEVLTSLEHAARIVGQEMTAGGVDTPEQARAAGLNADTWTPHLIITAAAPSSSQRQRINDILAASPRTSVAAVVQGAPLGEWELEVTASDAAELLPQQIPFRPQRLDAETLHWIRDAFQAADVAHHDGPEWADGISGETPLDALPEALPDTEEPVDDNASPMALARLARTPEEQARIDVRTALAMDPTRRGPDTDELEAIIDPERDLSHLIDAVPEPVTTLRASGPVLRLLGPARLDNASGKAPGAPRTSLKILAHLALAPGGHHDELDRAVWPGSEIRTQTRSSMLSTTRRWVGHHDDGHPYLAFHTDEAGYRLADALHLVYGTPLSNAHLGDTHHEADMVFAIGDVAHELAERYLRTGKPRAAMWAAGKGLDVARETETLWRDMLRATHQLRDPDRTQQVIRNLTEYMAGLGVDLEPETEELIDQITTPNPTRQHAHA